MALVAYSDDSDFESDPEEREQQVNGALKDTNTKISSEKVVKPDVLEESKSFSKSLANANSNAERKQDSNTGLSSGIEDIVDEDEDENHYRDKPTILASIPAAVPVGLDFFDNEITEKEDELTDVPTADTWITKIKESENDNSSSKRVDSGGPPKKKAKAKVKFFVPALSEFAEDDDDEEEPKVEPERKKIQPSNKGSGLFSVLPEPKHISVKEAKRQLVPHVLTKPPPMRKAPKPTQAQERKSQVPKAEALNDSDEEDSGPSDFFSLSKPDSSLDALTTVPVPVIKTSTPEEQVSSDHVPKAKDFTVVNKHTNNYENQINDTSADLLINEQQQEESHYSFQPEVQSSGIDEEAMIRLMGKRRGKGEEINFIDVSADDALLTRDEWMTKSLSEEKPTHSFSKKKEGLPSQKQKQKHQITYLAHQAKERELELKNNWAQNRMTKMQTQAKYGF